MDISPKILRAKHLEAMVDMPGWKYVLDHIQEQSEVILNQCMRTLRTRPEDLTSEKSIVASTKVNALYELRDWVNEEIKNAR